MKRAEINQKWKFGTGKRGRLDKGDSLGERTTSPIRPKSRSCICEALEAFRTPVPHSTCSEPWVGWAPPSRRRALSRRGNSLTSWVWSGELDICCPQMLPRGTCGACRPFPAALGKCFYSPSLYTWENVEREVKDFYIHNIFISLANFFYFISFKEPGVVFIISRAFKFFHLFSCFYLHDHLSTTFCGLFLTIQGWKSHLSLLCECERVRQENPGAWSFLGEMGSSGATLLGV